MKHGIPLALALAALLCDGCGGGDEPDGDADADVDADSDLDADGDTGAGGFCPPLPAPDPALTVSVSPADVGRLAEVVSGLRPGQTLLLADGVYDVSGVMLHVATEDVTIRSAGGDRAAVVLDGGYATGEIFLIRASGVTVADVTVGRAEHHPIHVMPGDAGDVVGVRIYNVHVVDPGQQGIKINPDASRTLWCDDGEIACSRIELTEAGRSRVLDINGSCYTGGIDAHGAHGWLVRDNVVEGFFCERDLAEHAVHFWTGSRDTVVERNVLVDNARGVGFGLRTGGEARTYDPDPCPGRGYVGHYGGLVRNNFVAASSPELLGSEAGFDVGIALWAACGGRVLHNTVFSVGEPFSSIEWRFEATDAVVSNNLVSHPLRERDGARATAEGNVEGAPASLFVAAERGDLHLLESAALAIDRGVPLDPGECDTDIDGEPRSGAPDVGADEWHP